MAGAGSPRTDTAIIIAVAGVCAIVAAFALTYLIAPRLVASVFVHALGVVAQLWPGAR